jgi:hypothetical protein
MTKNSESKGEAGEDTSQTSYISKSVTILQHSVAIMSRFRRESIRTASSLVAIALQGHVRLAGLISLRLSP